MAKIVGLPKLSPTMDEGTLVKWTKNEGDVVEVDDLLAEVETDKATMEFRSFDQGTLLKILVSEGETLAPDTPVAIIGAKGEDISGLVGGAAGDVAGDDGGGAAAEAKSSESKQEAPGKHAGQQVESNGAGPAKAAGPSASASPKSDASGRVLASPLVRRMAREQDLDLSTVQGSGPGGRVVKRDVEGLSGGGAQAATQTGSAPASAALGDRAEPRVEKLSQMRKTIARRLTESKQQIPHFYLTIDIDADPLWKVRQQINKDLEKSGEKISLNDLVIKAVAVALRRVPAANASFMGDTIHYHNRVDISVAVAIPDGLVTPVVRDADTKGALTISREVKDLAARAKDKKLKPEEMQNGTFSISNLGMYGIEDFGAVINPPEGAILAVGSVRQEPVVKGADIVPGRRMRMTLSCDHRVVDGAVGAELLNALRGMLENPLSMIL